MANLSELLAAPAAAKREGWLEAAVARAGGFSEGWPAPASMPSPVAEEDPLAKAYAEGEAAGRAAAQAEAELAASQRTRLATQFHALDEAAIEALSSQLSDTVAQLCEAALAPLALDHEALNKRAAAAAAAIGMAAATSRLHVHPDDVAAIDPEIGVDIVADPKLERGSLCLEGPDGAIADGPEQWRAAIAAALRG